MPLGDAVFVSAGECGKSADELRDLQAAGTLVKRRIQHRITLHPVEELLRVLLPDQLGGKIIT
jgi:hypothetical protein